MDGASVYSRRCFTAADCGSAWAALSCGKRNSVLVFDPQATATVRTQDKDSFVKRRIPSTGHQLLVKNIEPSPNCARKRSVSCSACAIGNHFRVIGHIAVQQSKDR